MGLTIHYKIRFKGTAPELKERLESIRQKCMDLPFAEVSNVEQKEVTTKAIDTWNFHQCNPNSNREKRDAAIAEFGLDAWDVINAMDYDAKDKIPLKPCSMVALYLWPGEGCESSDLHFTKRPRQRYWTAKEFCKTQYATEFVRCHLLVVKLIDMCKDAGFEIVSICDEGEYYETRDMSKLGESINAYTALIEGIFGALKNNLPEGCSMEAPIETSKNYMRVK